MPILESTALGVIDMTGTVNIESLLKHTHNKLKKLYEDHYIKVQKDIANANINDAPKLAHNSSSKPNEWKFKKFLNKTDATNQKLLLEYELWSSARPYANKDLWGKPITCLKDISMNIKLGELDDDEVSASTYMNLRVLNGLVGFLKELPPNP